MKILTGVNKAIDNYWRTGIVSGLLILDLLVLSVCLTDALRFMSSGLSFISAVSVALKAALDGKSIGLGLSVLAFFVVAMPTVFALLSALVSPIERWPRFLRGRGKGILWAHILLSGLVAVLTMSDVAMEILSGWAKTGPLAKSETIKYSFVSIWLGVVLIAKPVYIFYISPIIRKFLVRATAGDHTRIGEVIQEVVTEEKMGAEH